MNKIIEKDLKRLVKENEDVDKLKGKRILVTGANGLIAQYFTLFLLELNKSKKLDMKIVGLVRNKEKALKIYEDYIDRKDFELLNQDVCEKIEINGKIDYILHAAGSASAYAIKTDPVGIIKANTIGMLNVLELAREKKSEKVILASTREVYGKVDNQDLINESSMGVVDPLNSRNCYPESKRLAEALCESYHIEYGVNYNVARIAHTYGPGMQIANDGRVMADFIGSIVNNQNIKLNSDGTAIRSFCYITDTINGLIKIMLNGEANGAYNLSNETEPYMIRDVAEMATNIYPDRGLKVEFANSDDKEVKKGYLDYKIVKLDNSKLESLGWKPQVKLIKGMKNTIDYFNK